MIKHYILTAWRNLKRKRLLSAIQIFCLTVGLATFILIFRYIQYEKSWDRFNENFDRLYRVQQSWKDGTTPSMSQTPPTLANYLEINYPEVEKAIVVNEVWGNYLSTSPEKTYYEENGFYAPSEVFDLFSFELLSGNSENALTNPYSAILSQKMAAKYFPDENPLGKSIFDNQNREFMVTGIMKDIPEYSHIRPDYLLSISSKPKWEMNSWGNNYFRTYVLLKEGTDCKAFNDQIKTLLDNHIESNKSFLYLKPLKELHLNPNDIKDFVVVVIFYTIIGILILLLASINFANLTTAFSISRAKEIGIRKVSGSGINELRKQFLTESILLAFISMITATVLARLFLPLFNNIVERDLPFDIFSNPLFLSVILVSTLITGIVSGLYPGFLLSSFRPVAILKGNNPLAKTNGKISGLKALVTLQFIITVILISTTVWIYRQTQYLKNKNLGFEKTALFHCSIPENNSEKQFFDFREQAISVNGVVDMAISKNSPLHSSWSREVSLEGASADDWTNFNYNEVSPGFLNTYKFDLIEGSFFSETQKPNDHVVVINQAGAQIFGTETAIGKRLKVNGELHTVIGIVKNFHNLSMMWAIEPYIMLPNNSNLQDYNEYTFRLNGKNNQEAVADLENLLRQTFPNSIFTISHFDDRSNMIDVNIWHSVGKTFTFFTILAILIASFGLFGMVAYTTRKRIKEIGVRRVQGATSMNIILLVVKEFFVLLLIANLFVLPVPFILKNITPGNYKYIMESWEIVSIIAISFLVAAIVSSYEAIKAAFRNPVESLRYE